MHDRKAGYNNGLKGLALYYEKNKPSDLMLLHPVILLPYWL